MQCIINDPDNLVDDMIKGFIVAHRDLVVSTSNPRVLKYIKAPVQGKVGIVTGGGSGHKPAFIGYIGEAMVDAVAVGEVFSSPTAQSFYDAIKSSDSGKGVAVLYGNYSGDNMNVKMALELVAEEGIQVKTVVANDDVPSASKTEKDKRRGVAGEVLMWKVAGAKADMGGTLDEVIAVAQKAIDNTCSVGIGLSPCTIPAVGKPNFSILPKKMEFGIGHHGEPGIQVLDMKTAKEMATMSLEIILSDLPFVSGDEVVVLVSGLGATPVSELYVFFNEVNKILHSNAISIYKSYVGNYFTSLEMKGVTLTLLHLDDELKVLIDYKSNAALFKQFNQD
jgi:dihydroxyacetone kinase-like protein